MLFISAGHNSITDPGKVYKDGLKEFDLNLRVVRAIAEAIPDAVILPTTLSLPEKIQFINDRAKPGDVAVEIHHNSGYPSKKGREVYFAQNDDRELATRLDESLTRAFDTLGKVEQKDRYNGLDCEIGLGALMHDSQSYVGSLGFLRNLKCPSAIVECGYPTNEQDLKLILDPETPAKIARAIKEGVFGREEEIKTLQQRIIELSAQVVALLRTLLGLKSK